MAETSNVIESTNRLLRYSHGILDDADHMIAEWDTVPKNDWVSFTLDWDQFVVTHLRTLNERATEDRMTADQEAEYQRLIQRITDQASQYEQYGLGMPRVPTRTR